ncbi:MFS transporter [Streptomyces sp. CA-210063]|uniref:MFS transporter n=1 Tax=Streptomyces sp. CA-210063 TaxID=2801029 RepID=UPI00214C5D59|nr:MFS transporter [Streptomyces sp. CA-210063]UUU31902.1 MFS transporter [Streptomyces sp. CA-210063]
MTTTPTRTTATAVGEATGPFAWYQTMSQQGRRAFKGAFGGYALDSYDFQVLPLSMAAIAAYFSLSTAETGLLTTATLLASAVGGVLAGVLIDRVGRVKTLMITVVTYAVFTVACGFATNYEMLLAMRTLQGIGFGGEWAAGAILVAEYARPHYRGRVLAWVQSSWAIGWGLAVIVSTMLMDRVNPDLAWRILFWTGALPAVLLVYIRLKVKDAPEVSERLAKKEARVPVTTVFKGGLARKTLFATLLSMGVMGGYYTFATWLPTYLKTERGLSVVGTGGYLFVLITGAFCGYVAAGHVVDRLGRKKAFALFAFLSGSLLMTYVNVPEGSNNLLMILGFPLGFSASAIFSGFGSYLAELYPHTVRGTGQSFTYNVGRALGAIFPTAVGFSSGGVGGALVYGAIGYGLALIALLGLPETKGSELS